MNRTITTILNALLVSLCSTSSSEEIVDERFGFRFEVPYGFTESTNHKPNRDLLYHFVLRDSSLDDAATAIRIERLQGTIDPNRPLFAEDVPGMEGITLEETSWNGRTIAVVRQTVSLGDVSLVVYVAQFPLSGEGVQLLVGGLQERENETKRTFDQSVASFTNTRPIAASGGKKLDNLDRMFRLTRALSQLVFIIVVIWGVVTLIRYGNRRSKDGHDAS